MGSVPGRKLVSSHHLSDGVWEEHRDRCGSLTSTGGASCWLFSTPLANVQFPSLSLLFAGWDLASPTYAQWGGRMLYNTQRCHFMYALSLTEDFTRTISFHSPHNSTQRVLLLAPLSRRGNWGSEKLNGIARGYPANKDGTSTPAHICLMLTGCKP